MASKIDCKGNGIFWDGGSWRMKVGNDEVILAGYKGTNGEPVEEIEEIEKVNEDENSKSN